MVPGLGAHSGRHSDMAIIKHQARKTFLEIWLYWKKVPFVKANGLTRGVINIIEHIKYIHKGKAGSIRAPKDQESPIETKPNEKVVGCLNTLF